MPGVQPAHETARPGIKLAGLSVALVATMPCAAQSLRVDYTAGVSTTHSDNIRLGETDKQGETVLAPTLGFEAHQDTSALQLKARGSFQYADYLNDHFDDRFLGDFAGQMNWHLLPQRLALVVADYFGRAPINILGGLTAGNEQDVNILTAGPTLYLRPGRSTQAQLDLRVTDTHSSDTDAFDSRRMNAGLSTVHTLSDTQSLSLNLEAGETDFDADRDGNYDRYSAFAGYRRESARGQLELTAGRTHLRYHAPGTLPKPPPGLPDIDVRPRPDTLSGRLLRFNASLQLGMHSRLSLRARHELTDTANDIVARNSRFDAPLLDDLTSPNLVVGPNIYRQRRIELGYGFDNTLLSAHVGPYVERILYEEGLNISWKARGVFANADWRLRPRLNLRASGSHEYRDIREMTRTDRDTSARLQLIYAFSRHLSGWIGLQQRRRNSNVPNADYRENVVMAGFAFRR